MGVAGAESALLCRYGRHVAFDAAPTALLWLGTTAMGWRTALRRKWQTHREWMIRSYALTLSAITLRAWKYAIVFAFEPRPMDVYRLVAWLGFIPNLMLAEWLIRRSRRGRNR